MKLNQITWTDIKKLFKQHPLAIIPIGSTEQHGPHNPLGTDHLIAESIAIEAGEKTGVAVLPTVSVGVSSHHRNFPGTLWVSPETLLAYVRDIVLSLNHHGVRKVILCNGHGGNSGILKILAQRMREEQSILCVVYEWFHNNDEKIVQLFNASGHHSGGVETSMLLACHPELVHEDRIPGLSFAPVWGRTLAGGVEIPSDTHDFTESGIAGTLETLDAEKGVIMRDFCLQGLIDLVKDLEKFEDNPTQQSK